MMTNSQEYVLARQRFMDVGVDSDRAIELLSQIPISLHCWQGDDVGGFEGAGGALGGGLAVTGNYPGKARTPDELRFDLEKAYSLLPGRHRLNLHAFYLDNDGRHVERDQITPAHFRRWIDWAKQIKLAGMDFNPTCFSHPNAADGFTLAHRDSSVRQFWIDHCIVCRTIGETIGRELGSPCVTNVWVPDGFKDITADRFSPRQRLSDSLDAIFKNPTDPKLNLDSVESKLFGIGSESYVVGSHEFYLGYAAKHQKVLCLDAGHFHPTESVADKISAVMLFVPRLLLHVSRGVRWDSDHVVILNDDLRAMMREVIIGNWLDRVHIGLDYFDASIHRVGAWVIGVRATQIALLQALLEPTRQLAEYENAGDFTARLALFEHTRTLPFGAVWDQFCAVHNVPAGVKWLDDVSQYERDVTSAR